MNAITKTAATRQAREILQHGHYMVTGSHQDVWVFLDGPGSERITIYGQCGRKPSHGEMVRQLTQAIIDADENARWELERNQERQAELDRWERDVRRIERDNGQITVKHLLVLCLIGLIGWGGFVLGAWQVLGGFTLIEGENVVPAELLDGGAR